MKAEITVILLQVKDHERGLENHQKLWENNLVIWIQRQFLWLSIQWTQKSCLSPRNCSLGVSVNYYQFQTGFLTHFFCPAYRRKSLEGSRGQVSQNQIFQQGFPPYTWGFWTDTLNSFLRRAWSHKKDVKQGYWVIYFDRGIRCFLFWAAHWNFKLLIPLTWQYIISHGR